MVAVLVSCVGLVGCSSSSDNAQDRLRPSSPTTSAPRNTRTGSTVDPLACGEHEGHTITREAQGNTVAVHLPPCYDASQDRYPVIIMIHGGGHDESHWVDVGAATESDRLLSEGKIGPTILVIPGFPWRVVDEDAAAVVDLVPWIDRNFRTIPDAAHRAIGGISRGGGSALLAAASRPDLFGVVAGNSPAIGRTSDRLVKGLPANSGRIWLDVGEHDPLVEPTTALVDALEKAGVKVEYEVNPGEHDDDYWSTHTPDYLKFYASRWR